MLVSYEGEDQFVIHLADGAGRGIELRFPNQATAYCPELVQDLEALLGSRAVSIDESP